ncbi:hypothetical protein Hanom_Chr16g01452421 [Helianthus anomalus]
MYIFDTEHELSNRLRFFGEHGLSCLNSEIVSTLLRTLDENNKLVKLFQPTRDGDLGVCTQPTPQPRPIESSIFAPKDVIANMEL